ncbi:MAG: carbamoyltransferase [Nanoarchaeota archaeon]
MIVLGISCFYHDAAACIVKDGIVVAAVDEERFSRKKHDNSFPKDAINYCLKEAGVSFDKVDYIGFYERPIVKFERVLSSMIQTFPKSWFVFATALPSWFLEKLRIPSILKKKFKYDGEVVFVEHHLAHAASAFLPSPFNEAAILTIDGVGEWATATYGVGKENNIQLSKQISFPHSLGLLYSAITAHIGFKVNNDEYKIMGLAPYGKPTMIEKLKKVISVKEDGSFELDLSYFTFHYKNKMLSKKFSKEFGPARKKKTPIAKRDKDLAASLQKLTEEILLKMTKHIHKETKKENLCIAGGVALNSVANGLIERESGFKKIFIQPSAGDSGGAMGVALYIYNTLLDKKRKYVLRNPFLGPGYSKEEIKEFLTKNNIEFKEYKAQELLKKTAKLIYQNKIVGWFQGRMEWGPRALGARSILANACNPKMKDILNKKVKHREEFRPFAPVCPIEDASEYFEIMDETPFMLKVCYVKKDKQKLIPAVTHIDETARLQTIRREVNSKYYDLLKEFKKLSGVPVIVNTSFNIMGEPIVLTPKDAYKCFKGTRIDCLVMNNFLIEK